MDALVVTFREGIEAVLVIGILVAFLRKADESALVRPILKGAVAAIGFSIALALMFQAAGLRADNPVVEAVLYLVASAAVMTMVIWMFRTGKRMKEGIESRVGEILARGDGARRVGIALFAFAFFMVAHEGVETVLFLASLAVGPTSDSARLIGRTAERRVGKELRSRWSP